LRRKKVYAEREEYRNKPKSSTRCSQDYLAQSAFRQTLNTLENIKEDFSLKLPEVELALRPTLNSI